MKAKFVYENMEFKRGQDPKSAMGIGQKSILLKAMEKLKNNPKVYNVAYGDWEGKSAIVIYSRKTSEKSQKLLYLYFNKEYFTGLWAEIGGGVRLFTILPKYRDLFDNVFINTTFDILSENVNFERGQDPKSAMGIGMREKIKQMMEENNWEYENDDQALQWAVYKNHINIVKWLLHAGANIHVSNVGGDYTLRWAQKMGHTDVVELLKKYM